MPSRSLHNSFSYVKELAQKCFVSHWVVPLLFINEGDKNIQLGIQDIQRQMFHNRWTGYFLHN